MAPWFVAQRVSAVTEFPRGKMKSRENGYQPAPGLQKQMDPGVTGGKGEKGRVVVVVVSQKGVGDSRMYRWLGKSLGLRRVRIMSPLPLLTIYVSMSQCFQYGQKHLFPIGTARAAPWDKGEVSSPIYRIGSRAFTVAATLPA